MPMRYSLCCRCVPAGGSVSWPFRPCGFRVRINAKSSRAESADTAAQQAKHYVVLVSLDGSPTTIAKIRRAPCF